MSAKEELLCHLKGNMDSWVSGEYLSDQMSMSRSAIWKHIRKLRQEGYIIESSPKKGYALLEIPDRLLPREIQDGLDTRFLGKGDILYQEKTASTNELAKELASRGAPEGTIVVAEAQTSGRGRKSRRWFSPEREGVYVSFILRPEISPAEAPKMTLLTGVALAETFRFLTQLEIRLKWPNDILVHQKKIAGILTEISTDMDTVHFIVVGAGLNVNTSFFPDDLRQKATSLLIETGKSFSRVHVLKAFLKSFEKYYLLLKKTGFDPVLIQWKALADIVGRPIMVEMIDGKLHGTVEEIDHDGVLLLRDDQGNLHRIFSGDIQFD